MKTVHKVVHRSQESRTATIKIGFGSKKQKNKKTSDQETREKWPKIAYSDRKETIISLSKNFTSTEEENVSDILSNSLLRYFALLVRFVYESLNNIKTHTDIDIDTNTNIQKEIGRE